MCFCDLGEKGERGVTDEAVVPAADEHEQGVLEKLHQVQSLFVQAEAWTNRGLGTARTRFGPEPPAVATSLNNLALRYRTQGRYGEAEPLYTQALQIAEGALGSHHPTPQAIRANLEALPKPQA